MHALNESRFPALNNKGDAYSTYRHNLYVFYDEYYSDRVAYSLVEEMQDGSSDIWTKRVSRERDQFLGLVKDSILPSRIDSAISSLYAHRDAIRFLEEIYPLFDPVFKSIAHVSAIFDEYSNLADWKLLEESRFVGKQGIELIKFVRMCYAAKRFDLDDGLPIIRGAIRKYGFELEDTLLGVVCKVP